MRFLRSWFRRRFYPNGPAWFAHRISSVHLILALRRGSFAEALAEQQRLDQARLEVWLEGY